MKISEILARSGQPFPSIEIVPPLKGISKEELLSSIQPLMAFHPPFINVTCHRDEIEFRPEADGSWSRHSVRRRVSETAVCAAIQARFPQVEVVPHLIGAGMTREMMDSQLYDLAFMGIENVLALRGDCLTGEKRFTPEPGGYRYASELVADIRRFEKAQGASFCIGVGAYPEKHFEAPNLEMDIENLKRKVDEGADYVVTQMFFDNAVFYAFRDKCVSAGIHVPVLPGLKPLSTARQVEMLPESFSLDIPKALAARVVAHADDKAACYEIGAEWCAAQCADLLKNGVPAVHFYTMGKSDNIVRILRECF
ncbi:MAG: methylenetetrahydrofolate reductase [Bacteroidales bacterium]|nr:methylenetetrahydrofolate reductase [Bacteroidales bacterium]